MIVNFAVKHNIINLMEGYEPRKGDPLQYAKSLRPNAFAAEEAFLQNWQAREIAFTDVEHLHITLFFDYNESSYPKNSQKLAKTKKGYSCVIYLNADDLCRNGIERPQSEILAYLNLQIEKMIDRLIGLVRAKDK